jgi:hypothetical protein
MRDKKEPKIKKTPSTVIRSCDMDANNNLHKPKKLKHVDDSATYSTRNKKIVPYGKVVREVNDNTDMVIKSTSMKTKRGFLRR